MFHVSRFIALDPQAPSPAPRFRFLAVRLLPATLLLLLAAYFVFQPDLRDELREADQLFASGHYHAALQRYALLSAERPEGAPALRLGMVRSLRGEYDLAERALRRALELGLHEEDRYLALLYLGEVLDRREKALNATRTWEMVSDCAAARCPYGGARRVLQAEQALRRGDYAAAEAGYNAALAATLPADWRDIAIYRLALLHAARAPDNALNTLRTLYSAPTSTVAPPRPLLAPLLPDIRHDTGQLAAILAAEPAKRLQLLGQFYLDLNLYPLAEAQFNQVAPDSPDALSAAAYAAYTRWRAGEQRGGLERLEALVAANPKESRARTLLTLAYISQRDIEAARAQIDAMAAIAPGDADTHLAWANWYVAQRDYENASSEYQRALEKAPAAQRGNYALLVARFHLDTTYSLCTFGLPTAEAAAKALPSNARALTTLAGSRYQCGEFATAAEAARSALNLAPDAADATFYLGASLTALGDQEAAREALVRAADLAPASDWRQRAEMALAQMP